MHFLDVKTDYAFKRVFGSEKSTKILLSFLNATLTFKGGPITSLTIVDPYQIPLLEGMKDSFVDVKAILADGTTVIIEMQVLNIEGFEQRILYNATKSYSTQLVRGQEYTTLMPIVALTITDFVMFPESDKLTSRFKMQEVNRKTVYNDDLQLIFFELPKFSKTEDELESLVDKWLYFVKNAGSLEYKPKNLTVVKEIDEALEMVNEAKMTPAELEQQHKRRDFIILQKGALTKAHKDGLAEGLAEGLAKGLEQGEENARRKIAAELKALGLTDEQILKATEL
jgi:predicted transposase/invertase (TIGR01784 family)